MNKENLNKRERYKAELQPFDYFPSLESLDFDCIGEGDRFYLQDFGIYNSEITEDEFALRLRFVAGRVSANELKIIAKIVKEHDLDIILTARAQMQLHGLDSDNIYPVFKELNSSGISTWQTFGDNVRNIVTDIYDGVGEYAHIEVYPYLLKMQEYILKKPRFVGMLPRRVSVGVSGNMANVTSFFANDLYFALSYKEEKQGFNVYLGGKNTDPAQPADIFLSAEDIVDFFIATVEAFHKHGSRSSRSKTRMFHWIEDKGLQRVKSCIQDEYKKEWESAGEIQLEKVEFTQTQLLKNGSYSYRYTTNFAKISADEFNEIANFALENRAEVRLGIDQHIYILGLQNEQTPFENKQNVATISACAGSQYCPFSYWGIKDEVDYLPLELILKHNIHVGFSGCLKGCGKHQHADIGVVGLRTSRYGSSEKAARIFLGGEHCYGKAVAGELKFLVPLDEIKAFLKLIIQEYENSEFDNFELFSKEILNGYSNEFLSLWFLAKYKTKKSSKLEKNRYEGFRKDEFDYAYEYSIIEKNFLNNDFMEHIENNFSNAISFLTKKIWQDLRKEDALNSFFNLSSDDEPKGEVIIR